MVSVRNPFLLYWNVLLLCASLVVADSIGWTGNSIGEEMIHFCLEIRGLKPFGLEHAKETHSKCVLQFFLHKLTMTTDQLFPDHPSQQQTTLTHQMSSM
jgi:hypothetical protein